MASGTVNVISAAVTPPSASALTTFASSSPDSARTTATIPQSRIRFKVASRLIDVMAFGSIRVSTFRSPRYRVRSSEGRRRRSPARRPRWSCRCRRAARWPRFRGENGILKLDADLIERQDRVGDQEFHDRSQPADLVQKRERKRDQEEQDERRMLMPRRGAGGT